MPKLPTKAADNVFCKARLSASSFNERLSSREGAAEVCGIDRTRIARIELGAKTAYPEEVIVMADAYNAPELINWYCANECRIGMKTVPKLELNNVDRAVLNFIVAYMELRNSETEIIEFVKQTGNGNKLNGEIMPLLTRTIEKANEFTIRAQELSLWAEKNITGKEKNNS